MIPRPFFDWLKKRIRRVALSGVDLPATVMKYIPYEKESNAYTLPKFQEYEGEPGSGRLPFPPLELWLGYGDTLEEYLASGEAHVSTMIEILTRSGFAFSAGSRVFDFGCGSGRMIRQLEPYAGTNEIWGTDIDARSITWCKQNLEPPFHFFTGTTIPHLPFEDGYFDLIYAGSVFTHIDDLADAWLLELRRVLSVEGRLYLTLHDQHTMDLLETKYRDTWLAKLVRSDETYRLGRRTAGKIVLDRDIHSQVFYNFDLFERMVDPMYEVLSVSSEAYGYQTAVLLKRRDKKIQR